MTEDRLSDRQAFDAWAGPHVDCMLRAARRVLASEDLAWDAVQNVLLRFWQDPRRLEDPRAALLTVVTRASLGELRRERRRRSHEQAAQALQHPHHHEGCEDPSCRFERQELVARLRGAVARLPAECREVLELRAGPGTGAGGLDYAAIAARQGVPVGTVRSRLARARRLLGEELLRDPEFDGVFDGRESRPDDAARRQSSFALRASG